LFGHAIELALKSFLRTKGVEVASMKRMGHDLAALVEAALKNGLLPDGLLTSSDAVLIRLLNQTYVMKEFEYIVVGAKTLPLLRDVASVANKLVKHAASLTGLS